MSNTDIVPYGDREPEAPHSHVPGPSVWDCDYNPLYLGDEVAIVGDYDDSKTYIIEEFSPGGLFRDDTHKVALLDYNYFVPPRKLKKLRHYWEVQGV